MTGIISTFAGTGGTSPTPDGAEFASVDLCGPRAMEFDNNGNLWLALREGNQVSRCVSVNAFVIPFADLVFFYISSIPKELFAAFLTRVDKFLALRWCRSGGLIATQAPPIMSLAQVSRVLPVTADLPRTPN